MSDDNERGVPDLGFFAGSGGGGSPFTGGSQFGGGSQLGGSPPPFGTPAPFGSPAATAPAPPRRDNPNRSPALVAAALAGVLLLVAAVVGGRFVWSQYLADPVVPETLQGLSRATDAASTAQLQVAREQLLGLLSDGSEAELGLYADGQTTAYVVMSVRGSVEDFGEAEGVPAPFTETTHDKVTCGSTSVAQTPASPGVTICVRGYFRRAVIVYAVSTTAAPDPTVVALATDEAWDAQ